MAISCACCICQLTLYCEVRIPGFSCTSGTSGKTLPRLVNASAGTASSTQHSTDRHTLMRTLAKIAGLTCRSRATSCSSNAACAAFCRLHNRKTSLFDELEALRLLLRRRASSCQISTSPQRCDGDHMLSYHIPFWVRIYIRWLPASDAQQRDCICDRAGRFTLRLPVHILRLQDAAQQYLKCVCNA